MTNERPPNLTHDQLVQAAHDPKEEAADQTRIGQNVAAARKEAHLSQSALADRMQERGHKWHQNTVSRVENGQQELSLQELEDLEDLGLAGVLAGTGIERTARALGQTARKGFVLHQLRRMDKKVGELQRDIDTLRRFMENEPPIHFEKVSDDGEH